MNVASVHASSPGGMVVEADGTLEDTTYWDSAFHGTLPILMQLRMFQVHKHTFKV